MPAMLAQARFATSVTGENEQLLRSFHPSLEVFETVLVMATDTGDVWAVHNGTNDEERAIDTHVGGREVHIYPYHEFPYPRSTYVGIPFCDCPLTRHINPRRLLRPEDLRVLREFWPTSVGVRVLISGWVIILFSSQSDMEAEWVSKMCDNIGGQRVGYDVVRCDLTLRPVPSASAVASRSGDFSTRVSLGLRLRMHEEDVITTVTHGFVETYTPNSYFDYLKMQCSSWYLSVRSALERFRLPRPSSITPGILESRGEYRGHSTATDNSPIGRQVWIAGTDIKVGTISKSYDPAPSRHLPYPMGYRHDLCLITSNDLPDVTHSPNAPPIAGWGSYSDALDGAPLFVCRVNPITGIWTSLEGRGISVEAHAALAQGAEYYWDRETETQTASLLWRTTHDQTPAAGYSGSVLCLGRLTDSTSKALLFQNYESGRRPKSRVNPFSELVRYPERATYKGGFILPNEIRQADIIMETNYYARGFGSNSVPSKRRSSDAEKRRMVSGP
ncbi:hypothetical protein MaudCBS49596_000717 [Microsporum audouinii]